MSLSFAQIQVLRRDLLFATAVLDAYEEEDVCHTVMLELRAGAWGYWEAPTRIVGLHAFNGPAGDTILAMGFAGDFQERSAGGTHWARIGSGPDMPSTLRRVTCLRAVAGEIFAAGMGRQVFRRAESGGSWTRADAGALIPRGTFELNGFTSIDGFATDELYACGLGGQIWRTQNGVWHRLATPTNVTLTAVRCLASGLVLVGGAGGVLLIGRDERWQAIEHDQTSSGILAMETLGDVVFITTERGELFELAGDELNPVETGLSPTPMVLSMHARGGTLATVGGHDLLLFEGGTWTRIDPPF
jgi:hypothetical protein